VDWVAEQSLTWSSQIKSLLNEKDRDEFYLQHGVRAAAMFHRVDILKWFFDFGGADPAYLIAAFGGETYETLAEHGYNMQSTHREKVLPVMQVPIYHL
jgi:hypothetical protein